jgi:hypothetical protein
VEAIETYTCAKRIFNHCTANDMWFSLPIKVSISGKVKLFQWEPHMVEREERILVTKSGGAVRVMRWVLTV